MLEIALGIAACVLMARIATADDQSGILWGAITFMLCFGSLFVPLPFLRIILACVASFVLMIVYKAVVDK